MTKALLLSILKGALLAVVLYFAIKLVLTSIVAFIKGRKEKTDFVDQDGEKLKRFTLEFSFRGLWIDIISVVVAVGICLIFGIL